MLITAAAAGAIQLCGTARWSRALSRADSNHESALFVVGGGGGGGGEPNNRFLQVVCVVVCLVGPRFGSPSSSLPLGEDEEKKLHGIVGWPPACCGKLAVAVGRCAENTELEAHSAQLGGFVDGGARVSPACEFEVRCEWVGRLQFRVSPVT